MMEIKPGTFVDPELVKMKDCHGETYYCEFAKASFSLNPATRDLPRGGIL
jgi:hypothetical protein